MSISVKGVDFVYNKGSAFEKHALDNINIEIAQGEMVAIVGHTGSGKTTFVQHLNALVRLQSGSMIVNGHNLSDKKVDLRALRGDVGMVFQYPEYQLFADTVELDVAFGPKNIGMPADTISAVVKNAIELVGLDYESIKSQSPFDLSGGQKRRVALAGVLAMQPKILVLDEPTAGLDPAGKSEILSLVKKLNTEQGITVVMVSHDMNEVYENCDRVIVFSHGAVAYDMPTQQLFATQDIESLGLELPTMAKFVRVLEDSGIHLQGRLRTVSDVVSAIDALEGRS